MLNELLVYNWTTWNHLAVCKQMSFGSFKSNATYNHLQILYINRIWH